MGDPYRYLTSLGQALAAMALYPGGHPARERAVDASFEQLDELAGSEAGPQFSFLDGEVIYRRQVLRELTGWEWGRRLATAGIQRLEFLDGVTREEYGGWLDELQQILSGETPDTAEARQLVARRIRYGAIEVRAGVADGDVHESEVRIDGRRLPHRAAAVSNKTQFFIEFSSDFQLNQLLAQ